jgi:hypothetical protein
MNKNEFIETIGELATQVNNSLTKHILPSVCVAQACQETGYGVSETMLKYNAPFGIKATKSWNGAVYTASTKEYYSNIAETELACFRAYGSLREAVEDYYNLLTNSNYYVAAVNENDYIAACNALTAYATDSNYITSLKKIIQDNNLTRFDSGNVTTSNKTEVALAVFRGEYSDGLQRKALLGNRYDEIQTEVNRLYNLTTAVKAGNYGNGETRKNYLGADYSAVQYLINNGLV